MVCLFRLLSPPLQFGLQDWILIWSGNDAPCGVWTYGEGDLRQVSFPCLVTLICWIPHLCLVTSDLSGYTLSSSIYVRLMAVWDLRSESSSTTKTYTWTLCLFQLIYQISLWSDFPWRTFKYADYIWVDLHCWRFYCKIVELDSQLARGLGEANGLPWWFWLLISDPEAWWFLW